MIFWLEVLKITIPAIVTIFVVFLGRNFERQKRNEDKIREKKIAIYEKFVTETIYFMCNNAKSTETQKTKNLEKLEKMYEQFHRDLLFWGSDTIIKSYNEWRFGLTKDGATLRGFEKLLYAFRKDVGHCNKNLKEFDLFKLLLNTNEFDNKGNPINKKFFENSVNDN